MPAVLEELDAGAKPGESKYEVPDGLPGSINPKRGRGRPRGSTTNKTQGIYISPETSNRWENITALGLNYLSVIIAARIVGDSKYAMTQYEAECAAKGLVVYMFQFKQIRQIAQISSLDSPTGAILKGFAPYVTRVFVKDIILNVLNGPALFQSIKFRRPKSQQSRSQFNAHSVSGTEYRQQPATGPVFSDTGGDGSSNGHNPESFTPGISLESNWRDAG